MTVGEAYDLIDRLKKENETNDPDSREFNEKWIDLLQRAIKDSVNIIRLDNHEKNDSSDHCDDLFRM